MSKLSTKERLEIFKAADNMSGTKSAYTNMLQQSVSLTDNVSGTKSAYTNMLQPSVSDKFHKKFNRMYGKNIVIGNYIKILNTNNLVTESNKYEYINKQQIISIYSTHTNKSFTINALISNNDVVSILHNISLKKNKITDGKKFADALIEDLIIELSL